MSKFRSIIDLYSLIFALSVFFFGIALLIEKAILTSYSFLSCAFGLSVVFISLYGFYVALREVKELIDNQKK